MQKTEFSNRKAEADRPLRFPGPQGAAGRSALHRVSSFAALGTPGASQSLFDGRGQSLFNNAKTARPIGRAVCLAAREGFELPRRAGPCGGPVSFDRLGRRKDRLPAALRRHSPPGFESPQIFRITQKQPVRLDELSAWQREKDSSCPAGQALAGAPFHLTASVAAQSGSLRQDGGARRRVRIHAALR